MTVSVFVKKHSFLTGGEKKNVNHVEKVHTLNHTCDICNLISSAFAKEVWC